jgi:alpha-glucosidase (family GH31 glycosyl hydrolase)
MWANGQETPYDDGRGGKQTYGVHPFVLVQTAVKGQFLGIYFRNSNAMSPVINYEGSMNNGNGAYFSYITTGGQIEMYMMFNGSPKEIIQ